MHASSATLRERTRLLEPTVVLCASQLHAYLLPRASAGRMSALARVWRTTNRTQFHTEVKLFQQSQQLAGTATAAAAARAARDVIATAADLDRFRDASTTDASSWRRLCTGKGYDTEADSCALFAKQQGVALHADSGYRGAHIAWAHDNTPLGFVRSAQWAGEDDTVTAGPYILRGAIDGWTADGAVVECKLRLRRAVQAHIPRRERLQLQAYMAMTGTGFAWHVQRRFGTDEVLTTRVAFDAPAWQERVRPGLDAFVCDVRRLLRGGAVEDKHLQQWVLTQWCGARDDAAAGPVSCPDITTHCVPAMEVDELLLPKPKRLATPAPLPAVELAALPALPELATPPPPPTTATRPPKTPSNTCVSLPPVPQLQKAAAPPRGAAKKRRALCVSELPELP